MKVFVLLQILAFLAISVDADSICISTKEKKNGLCLVDPPEDNFKKTLTEINFKIVEEKLSMCFSFTSKNANETDCIEQPGLKLSDITEINFKHDEKVEEKKITHYFHKLDIFDLLHEKFEIVKID